MKDEYCLLQVKKILEDLKIEWFLMIGSALGYYRDGKPCPGDWDLDIGVKCSKEELINLFDVLEVNGFEKDTIWQNEGWEMNRHFYKYGYLVDIHFQFLKDEEPFFKNLQNIIYKGHIINIPSPIEEYLELNYGKGWKVPDKRRSRPLNDARTKINGNRQPSIETNWEKFLVCKGRYEG